MSSRISFQENYFWVNNARVSTLIDLAIEVGKTAAKAADEHGFVQQLESTSASWFPGRLLDLAAEFPSLSAKKFWAKVFEEIARQVFLRNIGDQTTDTWQTTVIGDAKFTSRLLIAAVRQEEKGWCPQELDEKLGMQLG